MNAHSMPFTRIINGDTGAAEHYHVPKYQREYSWGKAEWQQLLDDIEENNPGYFMGSIICVNDSQLPMPGAERIFEVVDGQQRLTTLSLLMMAIYAKLKAHFDETPFDNPDDKDEVDSTIRQLKAKLVKKKNIDDSHPNETGGWKEDNKVCFLRIQPSSQSSNLDDFKYLLGELRIIKKREKTKYLGNRLMSKAFHFFKTNTVNSVNGLLALATRISQLNFVLISVSSQADAFTLFETLNNRGVPLSAIDIIKNKVLSEMEKQHKTDIDESYDRWQEIVRAIPVPTEQERFLRQFYNAFRWDKDVRVEGQPMAIKSRIIQIYEALIKANANGIFTRLGQAADIYGKLLKPEASDLEPELRDRLADLTNVNAAPAFTVLLYLFSLKPTQLEGPDFLANAVELLRKYYVRRNVTDFPGTKVLDRSHMELVQACQDQLSQSKLTIAYFRDKLFAPGLFATLPTFESTLRGPMYDTNVIMTRYLLVKLDESYQTREYRPDLWERTTESKFVWTVEHVLPQTESISDEWVNALAPGDRAKAASIHEAQVHRLGNLTLSAYNSKLATASFAKKQQLQTTSKQASNSVRIGYLNGLALNKIDFSVDSKQYSLADAPTWNATMIEARTDRLVQELLNLHRVHGVD